jgi:hypothetical protein
MRVILEPSSPMPAGSDEAGLVGLGKHWYRHRFLAQFMRTDCGSLIRLRFMATLQF